MARTTQSVLGRIPVERFLRKYWQKEPLVIRGAFPGLCDPLTPDELAGFACEPSVASRLVMGRGGRRPWQATRGPQKSLTLRRLPRSHWTLLVESMDRHSDEIARLAEGFSFLPNWRKDDVMVSLSPNQGTVDAHIDSYDVFLIQGQGRRRWEIDRRATPDYRPGLDLRILKRFRAEDSWVLEPGDMLYVPPGVAHRGVTVPSKTKLALTYSVGFRAPSSADLLSALISQAIKPETPRLFSDPGRSAVEDAGELSGPDLAGLRRFLVDDIKGLDSDSWAIAAGEAVTAGGITRASSGRVKTDSVARRLASGSRVSPVPGGCLAWAALDRGRSALFVNGESRVLPRDQAFAGPFLCGKRAAGTVSRLVGNRDLLALVVDLLRAGAVELVD